MLSCYQVLGLDFTESWSQEDWPGWRQMGVQAGSVCKEKWICPTRPCTHMSQFGPGGCGSRGSLVSDFTRTTHDTHLCSSFRAELVELRCALCWGRHKGERDRGPLLGLNPSCSPLLVRTQCRTVYTRTSVPTEKRDSFTPR